MSGNKPLTALKIFLTFFKISAFTVGGGFVALPLLKAEVVDKNKWMSENELIDTFTMSQLVPGLIYVSTATFVGYRVLGLIGAMIATIAVLIPSGAAIMLLVLLLDNIIDSPIVQKIFTGIISGVIALTLIIVINMFKKSVNSLISAMVLIISFVLIEFFNVRVAYIIFTGFLFAIMYSTSKHALKLDNGEAKND